MPDTPAKEVWINAAPWHYITCGPDIVKPQLGGFTKTAINFYGGTTPE